MGDAERRHEKLKHPLWAKICIVLFVPFVVFAVGRLSFRMVQQFRIQGAIETLMHRVDATPEKIRRAKEVVGKQSDLGMLFLIQELQQDRDRDPRMARAMALRRVTEWSSISRRRVLLSEIREHVAFDGSIEEGFRLTPEQHERFRLLIAERSADPEQDVDPDAPGVEPTQPPRDPATTQAMTAEKFIGYEEQKITEVLQWIEAVSLLRHLQEHFADDADMLQAFQNEAKPTRRQREKLERFLVEFDATGVTMDQLLPLFQLSWPGEAKGFERVRINRAVENYAKKQLKGNERNALQEVMKRWRDSDEALKREIVPKLETMLDGDPVTFTPEEISLCRGEAEEAEALFRKGCITVARTLQELMEAVGRERQRIPHPILYELTVLLGHEYPQVRDSMSASLFALRYHKHAIIFLSRQAMRAKINPVMAVETAKLTKDEHERKLRIQNARRRHEVIKLLGRVQLAFCDDPYSLITALGDELTIQRSQEVMQLHVIKTLQALRDDAAVRDLALTEIERIKQDCPEAIE